MYIIRKTQCCIKDKDADIYALTIETINSVFTQVNTYLNSRLYLYILLVRTPLRQTYTFFWSFKIFFNDFFCSFLWASNSQMSDYFALSDDCKQLNQSTISIYIQIVLLLYLWWVLSCLMPIMSHMFQLWGRCVHDSWCMLVVLRYIKVDEVCLHACSFSQTGPVSPVNMIILFVFFPSVLFCNDLLYNISLPR